MAILSTNMSLIIPVPGSELAPSWSYDIFNSLLIVDAHNHVPGAGSPIPTAGLLINADLSFNNAYNLIAARSIRLFQNASALSDASDLGCVYSSGGDLYYNNGAGVSVRLTNGSSIVGTSGSISGLPNGNAAASYQSSGTFQFLQDTSTAANLDVATVAIRYPGSYPTLTGNYIGLQAPSSLASAYALTLPALPAQTNVMTLTSAGVISSITYDAVGSAMTSTGANAVAATRTRSSGSSTQGIGGVAISDSSNAFFNPSTSSVAVTGLSATLTSSGRPIRIACQPDGSGNGASSFKVGSGTIPLMYASLYRDSTLISIIQLGDSTITGYPGILVFSPTSVDCIDIVNAGTYTYTLQIACAYSSSTASAYYMKMVAYEL